MEVHGEEFGVESPYESANRSIGRARRSMLSPDMNWLGVLEHHASHLPSKPLAVFGEETVTYGEMVQQSAALAEGFRARGVGVGDVVGLLSHNNTEFLTTIFGANYLGAIVMPLNWRLAAAE